MLEPSLLRHPTCNLRVVGSTLAFQGVLRDADVGKWLRPIIDRVHADAVLRAIDQITVDISRVEYANASAWKCFVYWLHLLSEDPSALYSLTIVCDGRRHWQQVGVPFLSVFGADRLTLVMREHAASD